MLGFLRPKGGSGLPNGHKFDSTSFRFPEIRVEKIGAELQLQRHGGEDGKRNVPDSKQEALMGTELNAIDAVRKLRAGALNQFETELQSYASRIAEAKTDRDQIRLMVGTETTELLKVADKQENLLENARVRVAGFQKKLERFQRDNDIDGPPRDSKNIYLTVGVVLIVAFLETIGNGLFFSEASDYGWIGGIGLAATITCVNIVGSGMFGYGWRWKNMKQFHNRLVGYFFFIAFVAFALSLNLGVGHFRNALESMTWDAAMFEAPRLLRARPFDLEYMYSYLVAAFGLIVSITSFGKSYGQLDPYPGYASVWNHNEAAINEYARVYALAQKRLTEQYQGSCRKLQDEATRRRIRIRSAVDALFGRATLTRNLAVFLEGCETAANRLLRIYRDANVATRTDPAPDYFMQPYRFTDEKIPDLSDTLGNQDEAERAIDKIEEVVKEGVEKLLRTHEKMLSAYPTVRQIKAGADEVGPVNVVSLADVRAGEPTNTLPIESAV